MLDTKVKQGGRFNQAVPGGRQRRHLSVPQQSAVWMHESIPVAVNSTLRRVVSQVPGGRDTPGYAGGIDSKENLLLHA